MELIEEDKLTSISGGGSISGTIINAFNSILETIFNFGEQLGSSLRRIHSHQICPFR